MHHGLVSLTSVSWKKCLRAMRWKQTCFFASFSVLWQNNVRLGSATWDCYGRSQIVQRLSISGWYAGALQKGVISLQMTHNIKTHWKRDSFYWRANNLLVNIKYFFISCTQNNYTFKADLLSGSFRKANLRPGSPLGGKETKPASEAIREV